MNPWENNMFLNLARNRSGNAIRFNNPPSVFQFASEITLTCTESWWTSSWSLSCCDLLSLIARLSHPRQTEMRRIISTDTFFPWGAAATEWKSVCHSLCLMHTHTVNAAFFFFFLLHHIYYKSRFIFILFFPVNNASYIGGLCAAQHGTEILSSA